jgi:flagellar hook assembly protein FlgD
MFLEQNAPNPFNPLTHIRFTLSRASTITVAIFDVGGRRVRRLFSGTAASGTHVLAWDGRADDGAAMPSGVYLCRLAGGSETHERKMMLVR